MDHVMVYVQPFLMEQCVAAYRDGVCIEEQKTVLCDLVEVCCGVCQKNNIHQMDIAGPQSYTEKIKKEILDKTSSLDFEINVTLY